MMDPYLDAMGQSDLVRSGKISAEQLIEATIDRIERLNPAINAVIIPLYEKARAEAARVPAGAPFQGVPYVLKDLTLVSQGDLNTSSIAGVKAAGYRADHDSYFVRRMRNAGFVLVGKANTPEMGSAGTTEPEAWGACRNPWNLERSVGGSSGGSAAAVAAGMVPVAHGNDAGGSVRTPASKCGVVGLKPTRGRISSGPMVTDSDNLAGVAHEGLMARSMRDIAGVLDIVSGHHAGDAYWAPPPSRPFAQEVDADPGSLRIGILAADPAGRFSVDEEWADVTQLAARALEDSGHRVSAAHPAAMGEWTFLDDFMKCTSVVQLREIERYGKLIGRSLTEADVERRTWQFVLKGHEVSGREYAAGIDALRRHAAAIESWWEEDRWDLLVTPTTDKPPLLGELRANTTSLFEEEGISGFMKRSAFTIHFNVSGQPALSLPLGMSGDGLPIGVQIVAAYGREDLLLRVGAQLERAMPWAARSPQFEH